MVVIVKTNMRELTFSTKEIPLTNRGGYGIKGLLRNKLKKNEEILDVYMEDSYERLGN